MKRRVRIRLRTLLVLVALAGIAMGLWRLQRRREYLRRMAGYHDSQISVGGGLTMHGIVYHQGRRGGVVYEERLWFLLPKRGKNEFLARIDEYRHGIQANQDWHEA